MRRNITLSAIAAVGLLVGLGVSPEQALSQASERASEASFSVPSDEATFAPDRVLVKTKEGVSSEAIESLNRKNGARTEKKLPRTRVSVVKLPKELKVRDAIESYEASPDVEYAEPDYKVYSTQTSSSPDDTDYPKLYGLNNTGQSSGTTDADVDAPEAWSVTSGDANTVVAVIDTGVDLSHPDLKNNAWKNPDETAGNNIDDDNNGYVDDVNGYDFANKNASVFDAAGEDNHGTHVAGTIAAEGNNSLGVTGVNWKAKVMPLKFIGSSGYGYISDAAAALDYAVKEGAKISNNSYGCAGCFSQTLLDAIKRADAAGHLFVAAAGNGGADAVGDNNDTTAHYPSNYDAPNVVSVAATDNNDALAGFSNYGSTSVDVAAPGVGILSTLPGNTYGSYSGTSMATPHVAGTAALLKSNDTTLDDAAIKAKLLQSADKKSNLTGKTATGGRANAAGALGVKVTELSLNANPLTLTYSQATSLSGKLTSSGSPLAGKQVTLEQRPVGASAFSTLATLTTDSNGNFSRSGVVPQKNTDYRVRYAGEQAENLKPSEAQRRVGVKVIVSQSTPTTTLKLGQGRTIYGQVSPAHTGSVVLTIRRNGAVVSQRSLSLSSSRYSFYYKPTSTGTYSASVSYGGDADHLGNTSPTRSFGVVR